MVSGRQRVSAWDNLLHERRCLLEFGLPLFMDFWPDRIQRNAPHMLTMYLRMLLGRLARCYWVGLADAARPRIDELIRWMEWHDPDEFECRRGFPRRELVVWETREAWWEVLGLAKWLARDDAATAELGEALLARWDKWRALSPKRHGSELASRDVFMSRTFALALAADRPQIGTHLYDTVDDWEPCYRADSKVRFGYWACRHLAHGGCRDSDYVRSGFEVLVQNVAEAGGPQTSLERLLWLKAVCFDSGIANTAEEAVAREFDALAPGSRPGFLPPLGPFL